jgi:hypothetical protein
MGQLREVIVPDSKYSFGPCPETVSAESQVETLAADFDGESIGAKRLAWLWETGDLGAAGHDEAAEDKKGSRAIHGIMSHRE